MEAGLSCRLSCPGSDDERLLRLPGNLLPPIIRARSERVNVLVSIPLPLHGWSGRCGAATDGSEVGRFGDVDVRVLRVPGSALRSRGETTKITTMHRVDPIPDPRLIR